MNYKRIIFSIVVVVFVWSVINPHDYFTWFIEVCPVLIGYGVIYFISKRFRFTSCTYTFIAIHAIILMIGAHYSYSEVPVFENVGSLFGKQHSNYLKLGQFAQGFFPALVIREVFLRKKVIHRQAWLNFIVVCICLSISVSYQYFIWFFSELSGKNLNDFPTIQSPVWDTQTHILLTSIGSIIALAVFSSMQDRYIRLRKKRKEIHFKEYVESEESIQ